MFNIKVIWFKVQFRETNLLLIGDFMKVFSDENPQFRSAVWKAINIFPWNQLFSKYVDFTEKNVDFSVKFVNAFYSTFQHCVSFSYDLTDFFQQMFFKSLNSRKISSATSNSLTFHKIFQNSWQLLRVKPKLISSCQAFEMNFVVIDSLIVLETPCYPQFGYHRANIT